jgi:uncharacterized protein (TIGR02444 family)
LTTAWEFAVAAWRRPGVETTCLELQDIHGQCPALLLWRGWTLDEGRAVGPARLATAVGIARDWEDGALRPLRAVRERLAAHAGVRRKVLDAELEAEHALLDALGALATPGASGGESPPVQALADLAEAWRPPAPSAPLAVLIESFWEALSQPL